MGIPSYFSYIVKNHNEIIKPLNKYNLQVTHFYLDCNSIIYDSVKKITNKKIFTNKNIIDEVISKITNYIKSISPNKIIYIAFDGVAPIAKLEQQRQRRYKSNYLSKISKSNSWNTCQITPGTAFMNELNITIKNHFENQSTISLFNVENIIVTTSSEPGEGEHKIFHYIRNIPFVESYTHVIYGLDADLIMLSINHLPLYNKIYLFRETPEFIKSIQRELEPNELYLLDIPTLTNAIILNMNKNILNISNEKIYDYIFICFLLGNDFISHFPSINIRTNGIDKLLNAYQVTIGNTNKILTNGKIIYWENVFIFLEWLSLHEEDFLKEEIKLREKKEKINIKLPENSEEEKLRKMDLIPTYEREIEKYIDINDEGWRERYYRSLFHIHPTKKNEMIPNVVLNYLESLEWTMKYYSGDCIDWNWKYKYNYSPLISDIIKYGKKQITKIQFKKNTIPVSELTQLCYVTPSQSLDIIPFKLRKELIKYSNLYPEDCYYVWAFCRYFWESHAVLPEIDISFIEKLVNNFINSK